MGPTANPFTTPELLAVIGREAEQRGIGTIWVGEHVVLFDEYASTYPYAEDGRIPAPPDTGLLEPLTTLSFLAAHTTTVRLGTAMVLLPQRNPVYTAKEVATLDWLSNGRVDLGIGVGWLEEEFNAVNVPWPQRGKRTDEYLEVLRTLWCDETSAYEGEFYSLDPCAMFPKPVQDPTPRSTSAGSPTPPWPGRPGPARAGTPSTGRPTSWPSRWPGSTGCWPTRVGPGRSSPSPSARTSSRSTPTSPSSTPRRAPTRWPPCSCRFGADCGGRPRRAPAGPRPLDRLGG